MSTIPRKVFIQVDSTEDQVCIDLALNFSRLELVYFERYISRNTEKSTASRPIDYECHFAIYPQNFLN